jgi:hypothetical protein
MTEYKHWTYIHKSAFWYLNQDINILKYWIIHNLNYTNTHAAIICSVGESIHKAAN